jgi:hypothetical protein
MNKTLNKNKIRYIPFLIFIVFVIFTFINTYFKSKAVHFGKYDFVITKITTTPTKTAIPYQGNVEKYMWQYTFYPKDIIKIGDSIHKGSEEKYLFIFRKDSTGNYIVVDSIQPTGMYSWNYKT